MDRPDGGTEESNSAREPARMRRALLSRAAPFAAGILAALASLFLYSALAPRPAPLSLRDVDAEIAAAAASATPAPAYSAQVYQEIRPSLVLVKVVAPGKDGGQDNRLGSGFMVNTNGQILTCLHVVVNATRVQVVFADGTTSPAQVVTARPDRDIAVLAPDRLPDPVVPATLGDPHAMEVGDDVYAVGNPFGLYNSMSAGVISGFDRSFQAPDSNQVLDGLIQIDAAVNPGNSGGPLLNRNGQVIAIVTGIANPVAEDFFVGIGFAVPIDVAAEVAGLPKD